MSHTHTLTLSHSLTHFFFSLSLSHTHTHTLSLSLSLSVFFSLSRSLLSLTHAISLRQSYTCLTAMPAARACREEFLDETLHDEHVEVVNDRVAEQETAVGMKVCVFVCLCEL